MTDYCEDGADLLSSFSNHPVMTQPDARYQARGVSAGKAEVHAAIADQDAGCFPGAFCKIIPDLLSGSSEHCLLMHADGAGTKSSLAYLAWMEGLANQSGLVLLKIV